MPSFTTGSTLRSDRPGPGSPRWHRRALPGAAWAGGGWLQYRSGWWLDLLSLGAINYFVDDAINILYAEARWVRRFSPDLSLRLEAQFTDQRSVGRERLTGSPFDTRSAGGRAALSYRNAILTAAFASTSEEASIRGPFGQDPSYLSLMQKDFDRAGEGAWLVGLSYNFERLGLPGLSAFANVAWGENARDPAKQRSLPDRREYDLTVDYRIQQGLLRGLWFRRRGSTLTEDGRARASHELRVILNYEVPLL